MWARSTHLSGRLKATWVREPYFELWGSAILEGGMGHLFFQRGLKKKKIGTKEEQTRTNPQKVWLPQFRVWSFPIGKHMAPNPISLFHDQRNGHSLPPFRSHSGHSLPHARQRGPWAGAMAWPWMIGAGKPFHRTTSPDDCTLCRLRAALAHDWPATSESPRTICGSGASII